MDNTDPMAIQLEGLSQRFGRTWAVNRLDLNIATGEAIGVLGPNGSGKSTLLRMLTTLLPPTRGRGKIFGCDLVRQSGEVRRQIHWLGHDFNLYTQLTAIENLKLFFGFQGAKADTRLIRQALEKVGLIPAADKPVSAFSAGMRKRLAMAKIFLKKTPLILLDEPHTNLDREGRDLMNQMIAQWKKEGATLMLATHDHSTVLPLCDKILVLNNGEKTYFGPTGDLPKEIEL